MSIRPMTVVLLRRTFLTIAKRDQIRRCCLPCTERSEIREHGDFFHKGERHDSPSARNASRQLQDVRVLVPKDM